MKMGTTTLCDVPPYPVIIKFIGHLEIHMDMFFPLRNPPCLYPNPVIGLHPWFMSLGFHLV
jgi:hypothetical protein